MDYLYFDRQPVLRFPDKVELVVQRVYEQFLGLGVIDELRDMEIDGLSCGVSGTYNFACRSPCEHCPSVSFNSFLKSSCPPFTSSLNITATLLLNKKSKYSRLYKSLKGENTFVIPYNTELRDSVSEAKLIQFFLQNMYCEPQDENYYFVEEVKKVSGYIMNLEKMGNLEQTQKVLENPHSR